MRGISLYAISCAVAAVVSCLPWHPTVHGVVQDFPGWPSEYGGRVLCSLPLSPKEKGFEANFPGKIGKFTDGRSIILLRWVTQPTRKLHPASECFKAVGYRIRPTPITRDDDGKTWGSFQGTRGDEHLMVSESIRDAAGGNWTDVSSWYWAAVLGRTEGPWWAVTLIHGHESPDIN